MNERQLSILRKKIRPMTGRYGGTGEYIVYATAVEIAYLMNNFKIQSRSYALGMYEREIEQGIGGTHVFYFTCGKKVAKKIGIHDMVHKRTQHGK